MINASVSPRNFLSAIFAATFRLPFMAAIVFFLTTVMGGAAWAQTPGQFGSHNVGTSSFATVTVPVTLSGTLATVQVVTQGATQLYPDPTDFNTSNSLDFLYRSKTCTVGQVLVAGATTGGSCDITITFSPIYPGLRLGAILLVDAHNHILGQAYISGVGTGPLAAYELTTTTTQSKGILSDAVNAGADVSGIKYMTSGSSLSVLYPAVPCAPGVNCNTVNAPIKRANAVPVTGMSHAFGLAEDGAGNLYVADHDNLRIIQIAPKFDLPTGNWLPGGSHVTTLPITGLNNLHGLAVDGAGNLFIANGTQVLEYSLVSGITTTVGTSWTSATTVMVDGLGYLYVGETNQVTKYNLSTGAKTTTSLPGFSAMALDASGTVYGVLGTNVISLIPGKGSAQVVTTRKTQGPTGVSVDAMGNVLIADSGRVIVVHRNGAEYAGTDSMGNTLALPVTFPLTATGESTQEELAVINVGNAPLYVTAPDPTGLQYPIDFAYAYPLRYPCSPVLAVAAGSRCLIDMQFQPDATDLQNNNVTLPGKLTDSGTVSTSDSLGGINLSLTGQAYHIGMTLATSGSLKYGNSITIVARLKTPRNTTLPTGSTVSYWLDNSLTAQTAPVDSTGLARISLGVLSATTHTIDVSYAPQTGQGSASAWGTLSFTVTQGMLTGKCANALSLYGQTPVLTGTLKGVASSDSSKVHIVCSSGATRTSDVGLYDITPTITYDDSSLTANYQATTIAAHLQVRPAEVTITPPFGTNPGDSPAPAAKKVGTVGAPLTTTKAPHVTGLHNGDTLTATYTSIGLVKKATVGTYPIVVATYTFTSGKSTNYKVIKQPAGAVYTVTK